MAISVIVEESSAFACAKRHYHAVNLRVLAGLVGLSGGMLIAPTVMSGITAGGTMKILFRITIAFITILVICLGIMGIVRAQDELKPSDTQAYYKAKCVVCHGQKAEKKFDASATEEQQLEAIMNGKKPEKPPNMPAYSAKGVTAENAKALLDYMKQLRTTQ
jgi:mono/diheme cytochrome c family protein